MGQKVNPHGARVGVIFDWSTRWFADKKDFSKNLMEDHRIRQELKKRYYQTGISRIDIERSAARLTINIFTGKPGMIIGRGGKGIEELKAYIEKMLGRTVNINILEVKKPRCRRAACSREHRSAAGEAHIFPPRDEAEHSARHAGGCQGHQDPGVRSSGWRRYRQERALPRRFDSAADAARQHRLWLCRGKDNIWSAGCQSVGV